MTKPSNPSSSAGLVGIIVFVVVVFVIGSALGFMGEEPIEITPTREKVAAFAAGGYVVWLLWQRLSRSVKLRQSTRRKPWCTIKPPSR